MDHFEERAFTPLHCHVVPVSRATEAFEELAGSPATVIVMALFMRFMLRRLNQKIREQNPDATNFYVH